MPPRPPSVLARFSGLLALPLLALPLLALAPSDAAAQSARNPTVSRGAPRAGAEQGGSPVRVVLRVGERQYAWDGNGRCVHAPRAALYDKAAKHWSVEVRQPERSGLRSLALTLWRFDDPAAKPSISFATMVDAASHRISTSDDGQGRGEATFTPQGAGGRLELTGRTESGTAIQATIDCARFTAPYAVGG